MKLEYVTSVLDLHLDRTTTEYILYTDTDETLDTRHIFLRTNNLTQAASILWNETKFFTRKGTE